MSQRIEHIELAIEELEKYGLKGEVSERSKHLEIAWVTDQGRRFVIAPKTPSDWRGALNLRSEVRKLLRSDNLQPQPVSNLTFHKAMSLPKQPVMVKELLLQKDVDALSDWVMDLQDQIKSLQDKMNSMRVEAKIVFGEAVVEQSVKEDELIEQIEAFSEKSFKALGENPFRQGSSQHEIFSVLTDQFQHVKEIEMKCGYKLKFVQNTMSTAKKRGFAENGLRGMWRRK